MCHPIALAMGPYFGDAGGEGCCLGEAAGVSAPPGFVGELRTAREVVGSGVRRRGGEGPCVRAWRLGTRGAAAPGGAAGVMGEYQVPALPVLGCGSDGGVSF